jgi:serine phosphatase RsbU (regulator of sigma subunit)
MFRRRAQRRMALEAKDVLAAAGAVFDSSLDHTKTMRTIAATAVPRLADLCVIDLLRQDGLIGDTVAAAADPKAAAELERLRAEHPLDQAGEHPVARSLRSGRPVVIEDLTDQAWIAQVAQSEAHKRFIAWAGYRSGVVMPLFARGRLLGAMSFIYVDNGRRYDPERFSLMHDLAARAAMALDNAKLYEERAHVASTLQRSLLPDALPQVAGLELACAFHPAGAQAEVGGDFYDVFIGPAGGCWLVVGDVCGKGPDAAAVTALVRHSIRALAFVWPSPGRVLGAVNEVMLGHGLGGRFATAVAVRLELGGGPARARVAGAGHPAPLLIDAAGQARTVELPGLLLGVRQGSSTHDVELRLGEGETLVLYTDGLLDAGAPRHGLTPEELGERVSERVREGAHAPASLVGELERLALSNGEGRLRDDVAILAARIRPQVGKALDMAAEEE